MSITIETIRVGLACSDCACLVSNGDDSHMDQERADLAEATVSAIVRDCGGPLIVELIDEETPHELFRCALCGDDTIDPPAPLVVIPA